MFYQLFSRPNCEYGIPYRLIMLFDSNGDLIRMIEARSSRVKFLKINEGRYGKLIEVELTVEEYEYLKQRYSKIIKLEEEDLLIK
jgi:hypothetical protein